MPMRSRGVVWRWPTSPCRPDGILAQSAVGPDWIKFGNASDKPMLGDVLVFGRKGGGHVGLYVGEGRDAYHVLGGNQDDTVSIKRIARAGCSGARRCRGGREPAGQRGGWCSSRQPARSRKRSIGDNDEQQPLHNILNVTIAVLGAGPRSSRDGLQAHRGGSARGARRAGSTRHTPLWRSRFSPSSSGGERARDGLTGLTKPQPPAASEACSPHYRPAPALVAGGRAKQRRYQEARGS